MNAPTTPSPTDRRETAPEPPTRPAPVVPTPHRLAALVPSADTDQFIAIIHRAVCERFGLSDYELVSSRRSLRVVWPRQIAMALAYEFTSASTQHVAGRFNRADHGTVIHSIRRVDRICKVHPREKAIVDELRTRLYQLCHSAT